LRNGQVGRTGYVPTVSDRGNGATPRVTAVAEHDGRLVRFRPRFLGFAREYNFIPRACNPVSGWEKGKVEGGAVA
jgi:transposase